MVGYTVSLLLTCRSRLGAARRVSHVEGERGGGSNFDALHEEALPPALGHHPVGGGGGRHHEDHGEHAACEGDHLRAGEGKESSFGM